MPRLHLICKISRRPFYIGQSVSEHGIHYSFNWFSLPAPTAERTYAHGTRNKFKKDQNGHAKNTHKHTAAAREKEEEDAHHRQEDGPATRFARRPRGRRDEGGGREGVVEETDPGPQ
ncbi:hypothetical protein GWI33_019429 [Rhynchophorus ferrugineus]|uniref:Uncharacterized protein n=1 Tax=Rhynchophorus ferrugineus TaxID=354439 RepID=A0A834M0I5_RHYFE|nr:hypothetical protein GWI33_019429 [Rhynchophorus ferrugineus]